MEFSVNRSSHQKLNTWLVRLTFTTGIIKIRSWKLDYMNWIKVEEKQVRILCIGIKSLGATLQKRKGKTSTFQSQMQSLLQQHQAIRSPKISLLIQIWMEIYKVSVYMIKSWKKICQIGLVIQAAIYYLQHHKQPRIKYFSPIQPPASIQLPISSKTQTRLPQLMGLQ